MLSRECDVYFFKKRRLVSLAGLERLAFGPCTMYTVLEEQEAGSGLKEGGQEPPQIEEGSSITSRTSLAALPSSSSASSSSSGREEESRTGEREGEVSGTEKDAEEEEEEEEEDLWASGRCSSISDCRRRHSHPEADGNVLTKLGRQHEKHGNQLSRLEARWQQYKVLQTLDRLEKEGKPKPLLVCGSLYAGHGQVLWGSGYNQRVDLTIVPEPGVFQFTNFHGKFFHYEGHSGCRYSRSGEGFSLDADTAAGDHFKTLYAEVMSAANGGWLSFSYQAETECQVFHQESVVSCRTGKAYRTVDALLRCEYPDDCLHPPRYRSITQSALLRRIRKEDPEADGFVTVSGGLTDHFDDKVGSQFSFCYQKAKPRRCELGEFTLKQIRDSCGGDEVQSEKKLKRLLDTPLTLAKHYYDGPETMGVPLLRWLMKHRGFRCFKITHFFSYNCRKFFAPFLERLLQLRHDIKRGKGAGGPEERLVELCIKLINNG